MNFYVAIACKQMWPMQELRNNMIGANNGAWTEISINDIYKLPKSLQAKPDCSFIFITSIVSKEVYVVPYENLEKHGISSVGDDLINAYIREKTGTTIWNSVRQAVKWSKKEISWYSIFISHCFVFTAIQYIL